MNSLNLLITVLSSALLAPALFGGEADGASGDAHWAFQPVARPALPAVRDSAWSRERLDRFVLARLEREGMQPAPEADRRTWLRRASFGLTGLPPTAAEVAAFEADTRPGAHERVVERLLASPRYGERWGRHWLDVARYSDTKGYVFTEERRFPYSYTYRNYVIRSFNEDLPYDRFVVEQLAADQLELGEDREALAAMGFLTLGRRFLNNQHDIIDDRIDLVGRGLLGLTIACARCHDHKYDPIPSADYYSLYGVFASSREPKELPLLGAPEDSETYNVFLAEIEKRRAERDRYVAKEHARLIEEVRSRAGDYLLHVARVRDPEDDPRDTSNLPEGALRPRFIRRWREFIEESAQSHHAVFAPWHALAALPAEEFASESARVLAELRARRESESESESENEPDRRLNALLLARLEATAPLDSFERVGAAYAAVLAEAWAAWRELVEATASGAPPERLPDADLEEIRQVLVAEGGPLSIPRDRIARYLSRKQRGELRELQKKIDGYEATAPGAPARAMVLEDAGTPVEPYVFERGNPGRRGPTVPRQFLAALSPGERQPFEVGSGRLELARAIASPSNPLTARGIVNRLWMHHFGEGIVRTPGDFGLRSDAPTHPELLDDLARGLIDSGWSLKALHRTIVLSSAYRQSSRARTAELDTEYRERDPDNLLTWKVSRRRLELEAMRDALLAATGEIDLTMGGASVEIHEPPFSRRRSVYAYIERQNLPGVFRTFDFASPDTSCAQRHETTVPQQALYLLNNAFVVERARALAARAAERADGEGNRERVRALYRLALARDPDGEEEALALEFVGRSADGAGADAGALRAAWTRFAQVLLMTNEFVFID